MNWFLFVIIGIAILFIILLCMACIGVSLDANNRLEIQKRMLEDISDRIGALEAYVKKQDEVLELLQKYVSLATDEIVKLHDRTEWIPFADNDIARMSNGMSDVTVDDESDGGGGNGEV